MLWLLLYSALKFWANCSMINKNADVCACGKQIELPGSLCYLSTLVWGKKKEVIPIRLTSKHLCVENELLLHYFEENNKDEKKWLYYNIEKFVNKI